ncbi:J domain-containing protein [Rhizobium mongolense]|uniref:DnaJ like chaperone protein n=3 Tax=Rhizobium mongolense TaxID=57676 RepID=A0A1G4REB6_9HYPH|nr:DnaJ family molecular chaperone [Rhizobium mongolense]MBB4272652.1 DnaJ like chaperone protein [Rhizobium mongolense]TVZ63386.1 DnaJ like chaperone protein [Rhizobium mongolense USDA 1844]SCW55293.1 DnaJ like chaperone protein [Rhizobium mongolense subsp. loessense]
MSFWEKLLNAVGNAAGNLLAAMVEAIRTVFEGDPETRRKVAFSVAIIALSAKMAKADGIVSEKEVRAFRDIFFFPQDQAKNVARLYNLARQDVAGYEAYAAKLSSLCVSCAANCAVLEDVLDGLFHIAKADGAVHEKEMNFLRHIGQIFEMSEERFEQIAARHVSIGRDPYKVLGVSPSDDFPTIRRRYHGLVSENHPDRLISRGVPREFHAIANERMAALNDAYATIEKERRAA